MRAEAAIGIGPTWQDAFEEAQAGLPMLRDGVRADLVLLFASDAYGNGLSDLVKAVRRATGAGVLIGCSGQGVIGPAHEVEDRPAIALEVFSLPGAMLQPIRLSPADRIGLFGVPDHDANVLADLIGPVPVAGFFCNGEIGPVDGKNFLHGFTASVALILPIRPASSQAEKSSPA